MKVVYKAIWDLPVEELFASGHRACAGCGPAIAMRWITKTAGPNTVVVNATGCMEVTTTQYPETAWDGALPPRSVRERRRGGIGRRLGHKGHV
jgi:pyruvate ferredoxin oxidoreductase, beta subunit (EC 1.2.7.1)